MEAINTQELISDLRDRPDRTEMVDVREPKEFELIRIKGSRLIPQNELKTRQNEIDWTRQVVFVCRTGSRSGYMAMFLAGPGQAPKNLQGGIREFYYHCGPDSEFLEIPGAPEQVKKYLGL